MENNVDYKKYLDIMRDKNYLELYDYYAKDTIMDILGVARQENPHSSFLRWILDKSVIHDYGTLSMRKFLETVCLFHDKVYCSQYGTEEVHKVFWQESDNLLSEGNGDLLEEIRFGRYEIVEQSIAKELVLKGQRRADIFAALKIKMQRISGEKYLIVLIENKVHSQEHDDPKKERGQTEAYVKDLLNQELVNNTIRNMLDESLEELKDKETLKLFVYLNPARTDDIKGELSELKEKGEVKKSSSCFAKSKEFISLNYQYLLDGLIEPLYRITSDTIQKNRLNDYIRCLGQAKISAVNDETDSEKNGKRRIRDEYLIMAVSARERELAVSLFKEYHDTLWKIIESMDTRNDDEYGGFLVNEKDKDFWISLANLYRRIKFLDKITTAEEKDYEKLKEVAERINSVSNSKKHRFVFNNNEYESYKSRSIGLLCRDLIADYIENEGKKGDDHQEMAVKELRKEVLKWNLNWLREVLLFDNEVVEISNNGKCSVEGCKEKNSTDGLTDFAGAFFSYLGVLAKKNRKDKDYKLPGYDKTTNEKDTEYPLEIVLNNKKKVYVAKFWGSDDVLLLIDYLDKKGGYNYKNLVEQKF